MARQEILEYLQGASTTGYEVFGAHFTHEYGQDGVRFTVYAPAAAGMQLIGDCNGWQGWQMERSPEGAWSIFAHDIPEGTKYKYRVTTSAGEVYDRADPFAFFSEVRPDTASVVYDVTRYEWHDGAFLAARDKNFSRPLNIYEIHAGSWKRPDGQGMPSYAALADSLIPYLKAGGYTHVELLPLTEHPFDGSWGYQCTGYFAATSRYGGPRELMQFVDRCHQAGIGVILDFVPLHFVTDFYALHQFDGSFLYESEDEARRFSEWGTALFDYTKPHVLSFMKSALDFWMAYYHIDGVRYDAVSCLIYHGGRPENGVNEAGVWFLKNANYALGQKWPDVMLIAEDSSMYLKVTAPVPYGGLGFDYKWDLGFMNDTFRYLAGSNRRQERISASTEYFYQEKYILPFSHDEVVHCKNTIVNKLPGTLEQRLAQARALYLYFFTHPGKKLNFMGNELAAVREWDEARQLDWDLLDNLGHAQFNRFFCAVSRWYGTEPALYETDLHPEGFCWLHTGGGVFVYERRSLQGEPVVVALNFSGQPCLHLSVRVRDGLWREALSTEDKAFGGAGLTNGEKQVAGGCLTLCLPGYGGCAFKR